MPLSAIRDHFNSDSIDKTIWTPETRQPGTRVERGGEPSCLDLVLPPNAAATSPSGAAEIVSKAECHYGTYTGRFKAARCESEAETVSSLFTFLRDDSPDANNSEIDIEILGSEPHVIYLTVWTHQAPGLQKRVTRVIDMPSGTWKQSVLSPDGFLVRDNPLAPPPFPESGTLDRPVPGFDASADFYTYKFEWRKDRVTYHIEIDGEWLPLWDFTTPGAIPWKPATLRANLWVSNVHWNCPAAARAPTTEVRHRFDFISYKP